MDADGDDGPPEGDDEEKEKEGFETLAPEDEGEEEGQELMEDEQQPQVRYADLEDEFAFCRKLMSCSSPRVVLLVFSRQRLNRTVYMEPVVALNFHRFPPTLVCRSI